MFKTLPPIERGEIFNAPLKTVKTEEKNSGPYAACRAVQGGRGGLIIIADS